MPDAPRSQDEQRVLDQFAANLRRERQRAAWTQERLGIESGIHPTEINRLENGKRNPGLLILARIADELDVDVANLVRGLP